jgi:regulator of protease activity HflC (stomatin/prohibitin superfamily)
LVRERGEPPARDTAEQVAFWTELIQRQMAGDVDQSVRSVVARVADLGKLVHARHEIEDQIGERLQQAVARWGIHVEEVRLLEVTLDPAYQRMLERDTQAARTGETIPHPSLLAPTADSEQPREGAQAAQESAPSQGAPAEQPQANAQVVDEVMARLKAQGATPSRDEVERMVQQILEERSNPSSGGGDDTLLGLSN